MVQIQICCRGEKAVISIIHDWLNQTHNNFIGISSTALQIDPEAAVVGVNLAFFRQNKTQIYKTLKDTSL